MTGRDGPEPRLPQFQRGYGLTLDVTRAAIAFDGAGNGF